MPLYNISYINCYFGSSTISIVDQTDLLKIMFQTLSLEEIKYKINEIRVIHDNQSVITNLTYIPIYKELVQLFNSPINGLDFNGFNKFFWNYNIEEYQFIKNVFDKEVLTPQDLIKFAKLRVMLSGNIFLHTIRAVQNMLNSLSIFLQDTWIDYHHIQYIINGNYTYNNFMNLTDISRSPDSLQGSNTLGSNISGESYGDSVAQVYYGTITNGNNALQIHHNINRTRNIQGNNTNVVYVDKGIDSNINNNISIPTTQQYEKDLLEKLLL